MIAGLVLALLVAAGAGAVWLLGGGGDAERDGSGDIVAGGDLSAFSFREGDCWNDPPLDQEVESVVAVPCTEPHDAEAGCIERFAEFAGVEYAASELEVVFLNPTQESWDAEDDRSAVCSASDPAAPTTGSLRGAAR